MTTQPLTQPSIPLQLTTRMSLSQMTKTIARHKRLILYFSIGLNLIFLASQLLLGQHETTKYSKTLHRVVFNQRSPLGLEVPLSFSMSTDKQSSSTTVSKRCEEVIHFVFVKVHKAGSDTLAVMFQRFGHERNLTFILPTHEWDLRWPYNMRQKDYLPLKTKEFNILTYHCLYNRTLMHQLMPKQTKYIAILREPYTQFKSAFNYFNLAGKMKDRNISRLHPSENFDLFLSNPDFYAKQLKTRYQPNFIAFDLGYPPEERNNLHKIFSFVKQLDMDFDLMLIMEYFEESLVLLRRQFCWPLRSILYISKNVRKYKNFVTKTNANDGHEEYYKMLHKKWSQIDYILYDHFNETFWKKMASHSDINEEVEYFKELNNNVTTYCMTPLSRREKFYKVDACKWTEPFIVTADMCDRMRNHVLGYIKVLKGIYNETVPITQENSSSSSGQICVQNGQDPLPKHCLVNNRLNNILD